MWRRSTTETTRTTGGEEPPADDHVVVLRALIDRHAFAPLYGKYLTPVYRYCTARMGNADDGWDATSMTFAKAIEKLAGFRGGSFEGWLFAIAKNTCKDLVKQRHPDQEFFDVLDPPDRGADPEAEALAELDRELLDQALRQLLPRRERIVRLHLAGLKGPEIAARLGVSPEVVRQQQRQALIQLADLLRIAPDGEEARDD